ncbi:MAG TPA: HAMP domain-containing sensor histidine kinase [Gemmatimonadales bacterium]|nr:HAMP domain-containing sensor histidine kinase [Gemmatimonadales bacterium]
MPRQLPLSFRQRILLVLIALGAVPTAIAIFGWALTIRTNNPATAARAAVEGVGNSGRVLVETIDTTRLRPSERRAMAAHVTALNRALVRTQAAEAYGRYYYAGLAALLLALGALYVYLAVRLGGHLSRQLSRPIDELIGWTGQISRHEPIPDAEPQRGAPEFEALRTALRAMATELEQGRARELETERIRAFGEVARRVAHEMKNPLTPIGFAVKALARTARPEQAEAIEVLAAESNRLERLAKEFAELGRLPEGPAAEVDLAELLDELRRTTLPAQVGATLLVHPSTPRILGHYDPLRRAFSNLLRNAVEAMGGAGQLEIRIAPGAGGVIVAIADHGPGIPAELRAQVFEPYWTTKDEGTGLGLALVRQTAVAHGGSIDVKETPGGGATFTVTLAIGAPGPRTED